MTEDTFAADPADRPSLPPEPESGVGALRWVITGVAVVLLVVGAWRAYEWFIADVAKRRAVASGAAPAPALQTPTQAQAHPAAPSAGPIPRTVQPPAPSVPAQPPQRSRGAVAGLEGISKCVVDGQVTYTNTPCPAGSSENPPDMAAAPDAEAGGSDANSVAGTTGDDGPPARPSHRAALSASGHDPSQRISLCGYWSAEIERLNFEFQQPLPPPVLDQISTHLSDLRGQFAQAKCGPLPKALEDRASAPARSAPRKRAAAPKVVQERSDE